MRQNDKHPRALRPLLSGALRWKNLAAAAVVLAIAICVIRYMSTLHSGAVVAYLLYPASIGFLALLLYTRTYIRYPEVRLLGAFFLWVLVVIVLNVSRANNALSSEWFYSLCAACFLCFSLPYAFEAAEWKRVLSILALATVLLSALLCASGVFFAVTGRLIDAHTGVEGAFGIVEDGRLWLFCHPNSAAPICGIGVVLSVYLFFTTKYKRLRYALIVPFLVCMAALSLTDSRAGILATAAAVGVQAFLVWNASGLFKARRTLRLLLSFVVAVVLMVAFYKGSALIRQGYNSYAAVMQTESAAEAEATAEPETGGIVAPAYGAEGESEASLPQAASLRNLSDFGSFNGRTAIWLATLKGLGENPSILLTGTTPLIAGDLMTVYFPADAPSGNFHNSFVAVLVSFGVPGLLLVLAFIALLAVRSVQLIVRGLSDAKTLSGTLLTAVLVFTLAESMMEQFLFVDGMPSLVWVWFMLAAGFVFCYCRKAKDA